MFDRGVFVYYTSRLWFAMNGERKLLPLKVGCDLSEGPAFHYFVNKNKKKKTFNQVRL